MCAIKFRAHLSHSNMNRLLVISIVIILFGCGESSKKLDEWKTIEVGNYEFDFPPDFELIKEKGIDSYVGKIKGDSMSFGFDFGYYSNDLGQTTQEYLSHGDWRLALPYQFMKD